MLVTPIQEDKVSAEEAISWLKLALKPKDNASVVRLQAVKPKCSFNALYRVKRGV
jgi:hypothetical protein